MTPEGEEKKLVKEFLEKHGFYYFMPVQTGRGKDTLDILCCLPKGPHRGRFIALEIKAPGKHATVRQLIRLQEVHDAGGRGFVGVAEVIIPLLTQMMDLPLSER